MTFKMIYDDRNRKNLNKLADNTKEKAYKLYQYCIDKQYQILIYETIRTKEQQAENVRKGASKTMKSYHLVGQALDFVFVDSKGNALWSVNNYTNKMDVINKAKSLGFTWGGDWDNDGNWRDESFLDAPHIQYNYKGYGTDTFNKNIGSINPVIKEDNKSDSVIKSIQNVLNSRYKANLKEDGFYGDKTRGALLKAVKTEYNKNYHNEMGRIIQKVDEVFYPSLEKILTSHVLKQGMKVPVNLVYLLQVSLYVNNHKEIGTIDGIWGNNTTKALNNFRKAHGFKQDGLLGGSTWKALLG